MCFRVLNDRTVERAVNTDAFERTGDARQLSFSFCKGPLETVAWETDRALFPISIWDNRIVGQRRERAQEATSIELCPKFFGVARCGRPLFWMKAAWGGTPSTFALGSGDFSSKARALQLRDTSGVQSKVLDDPEAD